MKSLVNSSELTYRTFEPLVEALRVVPDGVQQVGLAQPGVAVDEQRVVGLGRGLGDRDGGGVGEPVARADDERLERVLRVQPGLGRGGQLAGPPLRRQGAAGPDGDLCSPEPCGAAGCRSAPVPSPRRRRAAVPARRGRSGLGIGVGGSRPGSRPGRRGPSSSPVGQVPGRGRLVPVPDARREAAVGPAGHSVGRRPPTPAPAWPPPRPGPRSPRAGCCGPSSRDSALVISARSRVSSCSLTNSFGAAISAVFSTRPSGRVSCSQARWCGSICISARSSRDRAHTSARSSSLISRLTSRPHM